MDITQRILELNRARGWSIYKLAKEAGISPSTLTNMIHRGTSPSILTLDRICDAYGITLMNFFYEGGSQMSLTENQREHLKKWDMLTDRQKKAVDLFIDGLLQVD